MAHVTCIGIAVLDVILGVDALPTAAGKYRARRRLEVGGGVAANASATVASLGGEASFMGCLGDDTIGDRILADLDRRGVSTDGVRRVSGAASPISSILVDAAGERMIVNHASDDLFVRGAPVELGEVTGTDVVLVDMRWPAGAVPALLAARNSGIPAVVDCDHDPSVNRGGEILRAASHVIFSLPTLIDFIGTTDPGDALRLCSQHTSAWVAATAGADGIYWLADDRLRHRPAFSVDVVDTIAAGDVFHGAFALAIAESETIEVALRFASAAAAIKCTRPGGREGIPDRSGVESFLERCEPWT